MNPEPNKPELKLAMAKLLPELVRTNDYGGYGTTIWKETNHEVLETEWLYIMQLVEQRLDNTEWDKYQATLHTQAKPMYKLLNDVVRYGEISATFNQRATAMCKVKGITV